MLSMAYEAKLTVKLTDFISNLYWKTGNSLSKAQFVE